MNNTNNNEMNFPTVSEAASHVRNRLKHYGIKASITTHKAFGGFIKVQPKGARAEFSLEQQERLVSIAQASSFLKAGTLSKWSMQDFNGTQAFGIELYYRG